MQANSGPHFPYEQKCQPWDSRGYIISTEWTNKLSNLFGNEPTFPYMQECADCYYPGWVLKDGQATGTRYIWATCSTCEGQGYTIPPEWTEQNGTSAKTKDAGGSSNRKDTN